MMVQFANNWLTCSDWSQIHSVSPAMDLAFNGTRLRQDAQFVRAAFALPIARTNKTNTVAFSVVKEFGSIVAAEAFAGLINSTLEDSGDLYLYFGGPGDTPTICLMANAVADAPKATPTGITVKIDYSFTGGEIAIVEEGGSSVNLRATMPYFGQLVVGKIFGFFRPSTAVTIIGSQNTLGDPATGASVTFDLVDSNGTSLAAVSTIAAGSPTGESTFVNNVNVAAGQLVQCKITAVGSTDPGANLTANILYTT